MKHYQSGIIAVVGTWFAHVNMLMIIPADQQQQLISAIVSILAGLLTAFLSKIFAKYFSTQAKDDLIIQQNQQICDLQSRLTWKENNTINKPSENDK